MKKVIWVNQENPTSAADALDKSKGKWRFFSYCTRKQLDSRFCQSRCGLCNWYSLLACMRSNGTCGACPLYATDGACTENPLILDAYETRDYLSTNTATLREFHAAARKVFAKLRSLK